MRLRKEFHLCAIADKRFLIPIGAEVVNVQSMLDLNEVGYYILQLIEKEELSEEELANKLVNEYEAEKNIIMKDLKAFLKVGQEVGFIES